ncbi:MAG: hypothetical protein KIT09_32910 [Bryobacteraceae bacterium]|nr:hypothetical protein [Bryobacteraceae bacterium]
MKRAWVFSVILCSSPALSAAQSGGLPPEWDVREALKQLQAATKRLQPVLDQVQPKDWIARGAAAAYVDQMQAVRNEIGYLDRTVGEMSKNPQSMTKALEAYLRLQSIDAMLRSLGEGIRRYQNPAVADLLSGIMSENSEQTQKLREYLVELVAAKEVELKIADDEAQRCRGMLVNRPPKPPVKGPKQ